MSLEDKCNYYRNALNESSIQTLFRGLSICLEDGCKEGESALQYKHFCVTLIPLLPDRSK